MDNVYLLKAVRIVGGQVRLASAIKSWHAAHGREVKVSQAHIWNWLNSDNPVAPAEHCRAIEQATNGEVTRYDLRPDVFGTSPNCNCTQTQPHREAA